MKSGSLKKGGEKSRRCSTHSRLIESPADYESKTIMLIERDYELSPS